MAVAAAAQREDLPRLKKLIADRDVGETRALLLDEVTRLGGEEGISFIADHADNLRFSIGRDVAGRVVSNTWSVGGPAHFHHRH